MGGAKRYPPRVSSRLSPRHPRIPEAPRGSVVAIDGPAGTGKSSVARALARRLGFVHLDTGAMYRAIALECFRRGVEPEDAPRMRRLLARTDLRAGEGGRTWIGGDEVTSRLRSAEVNARVSRVAAVPAVRRLLARLQRRFAEGRRVVAEGRDMGTVVFPQARWKFFLDADARARAERRHRQEGGARAIDVVFVEISTRDRIDSGRSVAPLRVAPDAVRIDTTGRTLEQVVRSIERRVRKDLRTKEVGAA